MRGIVFTAFGLLFAVIGVIPLIIGIWLNSERKACRAVSARIVDYEMRQHSRRSWASHPVYEYTDFGEIRRHTSSVGLRGVLKPVGEEVTIYISKSGKIHEKGSAAMMLILGIAFIVCGVASAAAGIVIKSMLAE